VLIRVALTCAAVAAVVLTAPPAAALDTERSCRVTVTSPSIDVRKELTHYVGSPDDGPGTRIQDRGRLASPVGSRGGVTAGDIGNLFIAGHRNTAGGPLLRIRELGRGDVVRVRERCADGVDTTYTYTLKARPRYIDFFTRQGRAAQIAAVPFHPDRIAVQPMLTLSTCATQEDKRRGDVRRDRHGNPPGRWVVAGVLTETVPS
jgi:sortase A